MTNLAPGLRWCKSCQSRTALTSVKSGKCPVCDPDQGNQVSKNADLELERIDSVLAGDVSESWGSGQATWSADGSHQDLEPPDDWYASIIERLHDRPRPRQVIVSMPRQYGRGVFGDMVVGGLEEGMQVGWVDVGYLVEEAQSNVVATLDDGTDLVELGRYALDTWTLEVAIPRMADELVALLWGDPWPTILDNIRAVDRWEDDGGSFVASVD